MRQRNEAVQNVQNLQRILQKLTTFCTVSRPVGSSTRFMLHALSRTDSASFTLPIATRNRADSGTVNIRQVATTRGKAVTPTKTRQPNTGIIRYAIPISNVLPIAHIAYKFIATLLQYTVLKRNCCQTPYLIIQYHIWYYVM